MTFAIETQPWERMTAFLLMLLVTQTACASRLDDARANLKKWGFAYCLYTYGKDESIKSQAGLSRGGYFEFGSHNDQLAYDNVMNYVKENYPSLVGISKKTHEEMYVSACLDLYTSPGYAKLIKAQDKFVTGN